MPDEPTNVKVARILGYIVKYDLFNYPCWFTPDECKYVEKLPDFANDPAFVLRMIEANKIETCYIGEWVASTGSNPEDKDYIQTKGATIGEALLAWLIAADAAGVEIRR